MTNGKCSGLAVCSRCGLVALEVTLDSVEDSVNELSGFERREAPGYFKRFVYHYCFRRVGLVQELIYGEAKDIPIDDSHSVDAPVFGALLNKVVYFVEARDRAQREVV